MTTIAAKLRELRTERGMSLQEVADMTGASKAHVWDLETGRARNPSIELLSKLARCFETSVSDLIGENPGNKDDEPQLLAMYKELKDLSSVDRETIRMMMRRLHSREPER